VAYQLVGGVIAYQDYDGYRAWEGVPAEGHWDTGLTPTGGSNRESCAMDESLTQRRRVEDDGLRVVNSCRKAPANYVPAAAVKRRVRALSGFTGRKEFCRR